MARRDQGGEVARRKLGGAGYLVAVAILAAGYLATARLGLLLDALAGFATLVWPPTGIALAALLLIGPGAWPGITIGAFCANYWTGAPALVALGIGAGNTLEALLGFYALRHWVRLHPGFDRIRDVLGLMLVGAL